MNIVGNQEMIRITNQTLILNLIKEKGMISRADIAKTLNLSPPSTSSNINQLLKSNLIREVGEGISSGGRKPILIQLNKEFGYMVGVDLSNDGIKVALGNICAEVVDTAYLQRRDEGSGIGLFIDILELLNNIIEKSKITKEDIKIIIIAFPGIYDELNNKFITQKVQGLDDLDIVGALKSEFKVKVIVKNDVSAAAFGEFRFGIKNECKNMLFLNADNGIGAGLVINSELYEGSFGAAGMINSIVFSKEHVGGIYKKNGFLETSVSVLKLLQKVKSLCKHDPSVLELCGGSIENLDFGILKRAYEKNNLVIKNELDRVVDLIAMTVANINTLLDLDVIVLGGKMASLGEYYIISIKKIIGELCQSIPYITYSTLKDNSTVYGMFAIAQESILKDTF